MGNIARLVLALSLLNIQSRVAYAQDISLIALRVPGGVALARPHPPQHNPSALCEAEIASAQARYHLPPGLLAAIGLAETGRPDPVTHRMRPWPWSVQAGGVSYFFDTKAEAVAWVRDAKARGIASIDTGCLQVNLLFHPHAFGSLDVAFDPARNVDYGARFLLQLHAITQDWVQAVGFYHSHTPELAISYQARVQHAMRAPWPAAAPARSVTVAEQLGHAWGATLTAAPPAPAVENNWDTLLNLHPLPSD